MSNNPTLISVRPRESPRAKHTAIAIKAGSPLSRGRTVSEPLHFVKQPLRRTTSRHALPAPDLVRAPGSARSLLLFPLPQCEGVARQGRRAHGYPWAARDLPGDTRARGLTHPCADASATPWRATRHRSAFAFTAAGPSRGFHPGRFAPAGRPRMWPGVNVESHARRYRIPSHPSNASRSSAPRGGRNGGTIAVLN